jgi:methyl-accepting chemotaxis protein
MKISARLTMSAFLQAGRTEGEAAIKALVELRGFKVKAAEDASKQADRRYNIAMGVFLTAAVVGGIPATFMTILLMRRMRTGFALADQTATSIAAGDLSQAVPHDGRDKIDHLLTQMNTMRENRHHVSGRCAAARMPLRVPPAKWPRARWTFPIARSNKPGH